MYVGELQLVFSDYLTFIRLIMWPLALVIQGRQHSSAGWQGSLKQKNCYHS